MGSVINRICQILGVILILCGVFLNEAVIRFLSDGSVKFEEIEKRVFLVLFEVLLVVWGVLFLRYKKTVLQNSLLILASIVFTFGIMEVGLRFIPPNIDKDAPLWIPHAQKVANRIINQKHEAKSRLNRYGFNDREHALRKSPGITRIAVLGDSFVWGVGVEDHVIWTYKLERLLNESGVPTEILHWGKPGWSTLHEYRFLKSEGVRYDFDLLLVGYVVNDPVMDDSQVKTFIYGGGIVDRFIVQPVSQYAFPNAMSMTVDLINHFFNVFFEYGYPKWLKKVYQEDNLKEHQAVLKEMAEFCRARGIRMLFVMTPENHHPMLKQRFNQVIPLLENAGIDYLNLYPAVYEKLHMIPNRKLWANPADGHPGDAVTDVYARTVQKYLIEKQYLKATKKTKD
jgi:hypothetical protein